MTPLEPIKAAILEVPLVKIADQLEKDRGPLGHFLYSMTDALIKRHSRCLVSIYIFAEKKNRFDSLYQIPKDIRKSFML